MGVGLHLLSPVVFDNTDNFLNYALYFVCGMDVADYYVTAEVRSEHRARTPTLDIAVLAMLPVSVTVNNLGWAPELTLPVHCGVTLLAAFQSRWFGRVMKHPVLATIGGMCYTIYMYHYLMIAVVGRLTVAWFAHLPYEVFFAVQLGVHTAIIVSVCAIVFRLTEKPFMQLSAKTLAEKLMTTVTAPGRDLR